VIDSVTKKTYGSGRCACDEAISDIEAMMMALQRLRSSCDVNQSTALFDAEHTTNDLPTSVRQLVTDSKNLVAGAMTSLSDRGARLRVLLQTTMHTLAAVFLHCCRLVALSSAAVDVPPSPVVVADVADHVMEAARSLRTTVEAGRSVLDSGSDAAESDRNKDALLATASLLAKSLSALVQKVKTV